MSLNKLIEASEMRFRNMVEQAPVAISILRGENFVVEIANEKQLELFGRTKEQVLNLPLFTAVPESAEQGYEELLNGVFITGEPYIANEIPAFITRNGKKDIFYSNFISKPLYNDKHKIDGIVSIVIDVTEQVKARKKIEEAEAFSRSVLESSPDCVKVIDAEGRLQFMNVNGLCTMEIDDFLVVKNKPWSELWGEENKHLINGAIDKAIAGNTASFQAFCPTAKGNPKYWDVVVSPILASSSNKINSLISVSRDVTEQMLAQKKIEESEKRYNLLLMQSPFAFMILKGKDMVVHLANESMKGILGKGADIEGKPILEVLPELKDQPFPALLDNVYNTGISFAAHEMLAQLTRNGKLEDGYYNYAYQPYHEADNTISGVTVIAYDVTSSVIANKKIIENELELRKIKDQLELSITAGKVGVWHWDVKKDELYWSNEQKAIYGLEPSSELLNVAKYQALVIPEDWERLNKDLQNAPIAEEQEYDFRIIRKNDGAIRWIKSRARNILDEQGELQFISGVNIDVTEQVLNLNKIQESEERFRSLAQALPQLVWVNDANGNPEFASNRWREFTGMEPGGDEEWKAIVHPDDYEGIVAAWLHSKATGSIYKYEVRLKSKEGEYRWHAGLGEAVLDEEKNIVKWVGAFTDIHEQKELSEILKESEKQFNTLANNIQNLAWMANGEGYIYWYNQRWFDYTGTTLEEMKGWGWEKVHHPDHRNHVVEFVKEAWQKNEPFELTFPLRAVNGQYRWFLTQVYPITNQEGKIINWIGTNTDITEQKYFTEQLEIKVEERTAELNGKNEELQKMNKELESFAYISSHDLQEPLRKIQTFVSRISEQEENNLSDNGKYMFNRMQEAAKRMQQLIQDLLAYSRTNTQERIFEKTDLNKVLKEVVEDFEEELNTKNAIIEATELCEANIIPFQFRQLLYNLISNSLKFSKLNIPPHIKIESEIADGIHFNNLELSPQTKYCHITLSDNGIGFEQQYNEKIFEVFKRLHGKEHPGTGIGLTIVKKIVDNHHGIITTTSTVGNGSTFNVYIPA